jgi:hypothetical protein
MTQQYRDLQARTLYCPRCRAARKVRERLLLVLPGYDLYEYRCEVCFSSAGTKKVSAAGPGKVVLG